MYFEVVVIMLVKVVCALRLDTYIRGSRAHRERRTPPFGRYGAIGCLGHPTHCMPEYGVLASCCFTV